MRLVLQLHEACLADGIFILDIGIFIPYTSAIMNGKRTRHRKLLELVGSQAIDGQEALAEALKREGVSATQSTLSKDLRELGILKVPDGSGGFRFQAPEDATPVPRPDLLRRELLDFVVHVDGVQLFVVLKTMTGHAQGVCEAIDRADWTDEVVGTVAGENTIFILCRSESRRKALQKKLEAMTGVLPR